MVFIYKHTLMLPRPLTLSHEFAIINQHTAYIGYVQRNMIHIVYIFLIQIHVIVMKHELLRYVLLCSCNKSIFGKVFIREIFENVISGLRNIGIVQKG